jgi:hypothetical protein
VRALAVAVAAALLGVLALGAGTAGARPAIAKIFHTEKLPVRQPNELVTVRVTCPPGYRAAAGSTYPLPPDVTLVKSASRGRERIFLVSPAGYGSTEVTFVVTCWKLTMVVVGGPEVGGLKLAAGLKKKKIKLVPLVPYTTKVRCPGGQAPAGAGYGAETTITPKSSLDPSVPQLRWFTWMPERGGWSYGVELLGGSPVNVVLSVDCIGRQAVGHDSKGRKVTEPVQILRRTFKDTLHPGDNPIQHRCPGRLTAVRTGFDSEPSSNAWWMASHVNEQRGGSWLWANFGGADLFVTDYLLCVEAHERIIRR